MLDSSLLADPKHQAIKNNNNSNADNHKMASEAISVVIDSMPEPFNKFSAFMKVL
jgi:hypothetical protein